MFSFTFLNAQNRVHKGGGLFSSSITKSQRVRKGLSLGVNYDVAKNIVINLGYGHSTYDPVNKLFSFKSFSVSFRPAKENLFGGEIGMLYNHFRKLKITPLVYGASIQLLAGKEKGVFFTRPEIGFAFPFTYIRKNNNDFSLMFSLTYGYNLPIFNKEAFGIAPNTINFKMMFIFKKWAAY